ncbi:glycosyltransferase [Mycoplasmoides alvi]|uniref:glycosyltransferase n=1 Tax=Mycoplasmoides alvi TaxID=78580 RepID=UPI00051C614D|nr:glycosyltransferase [Mycoplasmoides alvi]
MDNKQKNIQFLNKITNEANKNNQPIQIHVYGDGPDKHLIENNPDIILHGPFKNENINLILNKVKLLLLPSKYEGFPLIVVEALSHGIPCIIANTYLNASFLIDDTRGKLIDSFDSKLWLEAINKIMNLSNNEYNQLVQNCIEFAKNNLSLEQFENRWLQIVKN